MAKNTQGFVYFLRFAAPISEQHTTQHYIGWTQDLSIRIETHHKSPDARLLQVAKERGIDFEVARVWTGTPADEKYLKSLKAGHAIYSGRTIKRMADRELSQRDIQLTLSLPF